MLSTIDECGSQIAGNCVFNCHLSPIGRQTAGESSVSSDPGSTFVDIFDIFDCRSLKCLFRPIEYIAKTIRNKGY